jgi:hypothetical protein
MFIQSKYENSIWPRILAPLVAGLLVSATYQSRAQAATPIYVVPDDGYGVQECLTQKSDCGKIVADAWCESHGHGPAHAFGRAEDITASIGDPNIRSQAAQPNAAVVSCKE